jgi:hypothetical protein
VLDVRSDLLNQRKTGRSGTPCVLNAGSSQRIVVEINYPFPTKTAPSSEMLSSPAPPALGCGQFFPHL